MIVVFSIAKSRTCFVEYKYHDSLEAPLIERIGHNCQKQPLTLSSSLVDGCEMKMQSLMPSYPPNLLKIRNPKKLIFHSLLTNTAYATNTKLAHSEVVKGVVWGDI